MKNLKPPVPSSLTCTKNLEKIHNNVKIGHYLKPDTIKELEKMYQRGDCHYELILSHDAQQEIKKVAQKDKIHFKHLMKKMERVLEDPYHFKPLQGPLFGVRRIHVGSFVLTYEVEEDEKRIILLHYLHHKNVYDPKNR